MLPTHNFFFNSVQEKTIRVADRTCILCGVEKTSSSSLKGTYVPVPICRVSDPDPDWICIQSGQWPTKVEKFMFWSVGWPLLWAAGFFCNLDILYGGLGIGKLQFLIKKNLIFFSAVIFFQFLVIKALEPDWTRIRIRIGLQPQPLDPDPDPEKLNTDPKPCLSVTVFFISSIIWVNLINYATWSIMYCRYSIVPPEHMHVINEVPRMIKIQIWDFQKVIGRIRIQLWVKTRRKN